VVLLIQSFIAVYMCSSHSHSAANGHGDHDGLEKDRRQAASNDDEDDDDESVQKARAWDDYKDGKSALCVVYIVVIISSSS